ncbi:LysR family transcriptional regulator [Vibrio lamellibrachiae]|uniref:LysR family transcriptional regulator n=1 Tax=Vibrio lamellibrachiae TaxID=2910253 RepID=UPI003D143C8F
MNEKRLQNCMRNDMSLLIPLYALLQEKHVTRAAEKLDISQSAMSQYLSKIRTVFDNDILVRQGNKMLLTPIAEQMLPALEKIVESIDFLHDLTEVKPEEKNIKFTLSVNDVYGIATKALLNWAQAQDPRVLLSVKPRSEHIYIDIEEGNIDLAIGNLPDAPDYLYSRKLGEIKYRLFDSIENPVLEKKHHTAEEIAQCFFASLSGNGQGEILATEQFSQIGMERKVAFQAHSFSGIVDAVKHQDLIAFLPELYSVGNDIYPIDCDLSFKVNIYLYWHPKMHKDPTHTWIRNNLYELVNTRYFSDEPLFIAHK